MILWVGVTALMSYVFTRHVIVRVTGDRPGIWVWALPLGDPYEDPLNLVFAYYRKPFGEWATVYRRNTGREFSHAAYLLPDSDYSVWWFRNDSVGIHVCESPYLP
jgi:hypothetical protein